MSDLGDLSDYLKMGSGVADLSWLDVNEQEYREQDTLPKQNLQIQPDLEALWDHEDKPATAYLEPNTGAPQTMGDLSQVHGHLRASPEDILRSTRMAMMQTTDTARIYQALVSRYDRDSIKAASTVLTPVLSERGLLGRYYIEASDFPTCHTGAKAPIDFVKKHAASAPYVRAKAACVNCIHAGKSTAGGMTCSVLHKQLVVEVPYTEDLAASVEGLQRAKGKQATCAATPKERIRLAILAPEMPLIAPIAIKPVDCVSRLLNPVSAPTPVVLPVNISRECQAAKDVISAAVQSGSITLAVAKEAFAKVALASTACDCDRVRGEVLSTLPADAVVYSGSGKPFIPRAATTEDLQQQEQEKQASLDLERRAAPIKEMLRQGALKKLADSELLASLRSAFDLQDLQDTLPLWAPLFKVARLSSVQEPEHDVLHIVDIRRDKQAAKQVIDSALQSGHINVALAKAAYAQLATAVTAEDCTRIQIEVQAQTPESVVPYQGAGIQSVATQQVSAQEKQDALEQSEQAQKEASAKVVVAALQKRAAPVQALLRREMTKGRSQQELVTAMRMAFDVRDLQETRALWEPTFKEAGLFGVVYASCEGFNSCAEGADFLARHNPGIRYLVAGTKCPGCIYSKIGRCLLYGKPLAASVAEVLTPETVAAVVQEHVYAGRLQARQEWPTDPATALKAVHAAVAAREAPMVTRSSIQTAFVSTASQEGGTSGITRREIVRTARRYLNEGLYGAQLLEAMRTQFDPRDIMAAQEDLRPVLDKQGYQGIAYIDPSVYSDYGHGCEEAARLHRSRVLHTVLACDKCQSCVCQTKPGHCSKLNKNLVTASALPDKLAFQKAIFATGQATEHRYADLVNNGHSAVLEYEMERRAMEISVDPPAASPEDIVVLFGNQGVKL